jgi:hypothetical protein
MQSIQLNQIIGNSTDESELACSSEDCELEEDDG